MQLFDCPFCGKRDEREFFFAGEAGKTRPDTRNTIDAAAWGEYLYDKRNEKGEVREIWIHLPCAETFLMERDSVTMAVLQTHCLRKDAP